MPNYFTRKTTQNNNKLHAQKVTVDGHLFDSKKEAKRYTELLYLQRAGEIRDLELQKPFELLPAQYEESTEVYTKGKNAGLPKRGKLIERALFYIADFAYYDKDGNYVVEDVKGYRDPSTATYGKYVIKRKLMLHRYGISIKEI